MLRLWKAQDCQTPRLLSVCPRPDRGKLCASTYPPVSKIEEHALQIGCSKMTLFPIRLNPLVQIERDEIVGPWVYGPFIGCARRKRGVVTLFRQGGQREQPLCTAYNYRNGRRFARSMNSPPPPQSSPVLASPARVHPPYTSDPRSLRSQVPVSSPQSVLPSSFENPFFILPTLEGERARRIAPSNNQPVG